VKTAIKLVAFLSYKIAEEQGWKERI